MRAHLLLFALYSLITISVKAESRHLFRSYPFVVTNHNDVSSQYRRGPMTMSSSPVLLASSTTSKRRNTRKSKADNKNSKALVSADDNNDEDTAPVTWDDLHPVAKVIAGSVKIGVIFGLEYAQGWLGGYFLGCVTGIPSLMFKPSGAGAAAQPLSAEVSKRFGRFHGKSLRWANQWAPISAIFGGFSAATKVVRGNVEDEWNTVISSAAAGAYFSRANGPQAMVRGAVMYGGFTYLVSGPGRGQKKLDSTEEVEF
mmetsp:Transcript_28243/g.39747  ORF Transcript_28243/g.39747 Transcript_28243/m.39747 type:complete len:256 (+) Transcript_28243:286-1053(+)